jgi:hypothetical protein
MSTFGAVRPSGGGEAERRGAERRRILVTLAPLGVLALACCALVLSGGSDSHAEVRSCTPTHPSVSTCCSARSSAASPLRDFCSSFLPGCDTRTSRGLALDKMLGEIWCDEGTRGMGRGVGQGGKGTTSPKPALCCSHKAEHSNVTRTPADCFSSRVPTCLFSIAGSCF